MLVTRKVRLINNKWFLCPIIYTEAPEEAGADAIFDYISGGEEEFEVEFTSFPYSDGCGLSYHGLDSSEVEGGYYSVRMTEFKDAGDLIVRLGDPLLYIFDYRITPYVYIRKKKKG
jgi:hypothetical protein